MLDLNHEGMHRIICVSFHSIPFHFFLINRKDPQEFFAWPVNDVIAPSYSTIIQCPMDFSTMRKKIDDGDYPSVTEFRVSVAFSVRFALMVSLLTASRNRSYCRTCRTVVKIDHLVVSV